MMLELSLAYTFLEPASLVVVDNIELNGAFHDFCVGNALRSVELYSYNTRERTWKHGLAWT
jgi:hypothetical protein